MGFDGPGWETPELTPAAATALLGRDGVFASLEPAALRCVVDGGRIVHTAPDRVVMRRGDPAADVLCLIDGRVRVEQRTHDGAPILLGEVGPGQLLGELSVLHGCPRTATVTTLEACAFLALEPTEFLPLLVRHPAIGLRLLGTMGERVRRLTDAFETLRADTGAGPLRAA